MKTFTKFPTVHREALFHEEREAVPFDGEKWVVGEKALSHQRGCYYIRDVEELVTFYPLYLLAVKKMLGIEGNRIPAVISLPLDVYVAEKKKREEGKENLLERLRGYCSSYGFDVDVKPQGVAGLQHLISIGRIGVAPTLLVDGGFNTVNVAVVDGELNVVFYKTFPDEIGVRNLVEDFFADELKKRFSSITTNLVVLKEVFLSGVVDTGLKRIDVRPEKEKALHRFIQKFFRKVLGEVRRAGASYEQIVFIGGISYYLSPDDFETDKKLFIPKEGAEFCNVLGLFDLAENSPVLAVDLGFGDCKVAFVGGGDEG